MRKLLLCTDLDRTLLPNGTQAESASVRERFSQLASRDEVTLVYVSGRDKLLVQKAIRNYQIPRPDYVIADVGSTIYQVDDTQWKHIKEWDLQISNDWNGKSNEELKELLKSIRDIRTQEYSKQKQHKLSYNVPLYIDHVNLLSEIKSCLEPENVKVNLIWSVDETTNIGLLDILPLSANKKYAIEFLMKILDFNINETIFAGDSGNDISVMASNIPSVLVANATDCVKKTALKQAQINGENKSFYIAKGNYLGMNGNYAGGILEGVVHYVPIVENWIGLRND